MAKLYIRFNYDIISDSCHYGKMHIVHDCNGFRLIPPFSKPPLFRLALYDGVVKNYMVSICRRLSETWIIFLTFIRFKNIVDRSSSIVKGFSDEASRGTQKGG